MGFAEDAPDWLTTVTELHMDVQSTAFNYAANLVIPSVFQITPPGMVDGGATGRCLT
mgnify:CR=1 FL=1